MPIPILPILFQSRAEEFSQIEVLDSGKPIWEARCDVDGCADTIEYFGGLASSLTGNQHFYIVAVS